MKWQSELQPGDPLADAIEAIVGERPPLRTSGAFCFNDLCEEDQDWIQDWCCNRARPHWATGLSMIEAAELIVESAIENANIVSKDEVHRGSRETEEAAAKRRRKTS